MVFDNKKRITGNSEDIFHDNQNRAYARYILMNEISLDGEGISYDSDKHVNAIIIDDTKNTELCLALVRQTALICHYPNFDDESGRNRTKITYITFSTDADAIIKSIKKETGNLMDLCHWTLSSYRNDDSDTGCHRIMHSNKNEKSFIDIEFDIIVMENDNKDCGWECIISNLLSEDSSAIFTVFGSPEVIQALEDSDKLKNKSHEFHEINSKIPINISTSIDVSNAMVINMIYNVGTYLKNISPSNLYNAKDYDMALKTFIQHSPKQRIKDKWDEMKDSPELKMANICCADCLETKLRSLSASCSNVSPNINKLLQKQLKWFANSEHARWNVEKLIFGFRPYNEEEMYEDEFLFGEEQTQKRRRMKKKFIHIDICSINDLIRIDPGSFKYDCFLSLAINDIINKAEIL